MMISERNAEFEARTQFISTSTSIS